MQRNLNRSSANRSRQVLKREERIVSTYGRSKRVTEGTTVNLASNASNWFKGAEPIEPASNTAETGTIDYHHTAAEADQCGSQLSAVYQLLREIGYRVRSRAQQGEGGAEKVRKTKSDINVTAGLIELSSED